MRHSEEFWGSLYRNGYEGGHSVDASIKWLRENGALLVELCYNDDWSLKVFYARGDLQPGGVQVFEGKRKGAVDLCQDAVVWTLNEKFGKDLTCNI